MKLSDHGIRHSENYAPPRGVRIAAAGSNRGMSVTAGDPRSLIQVLQGLAALLENTEWQDKALCAQTDPEAFFPEKGGSTREAKRVCRNCEVRWECLDYALENNERYGIWGGLSERERRPLMRQAA